MLHRHFHILIQLMGSLRNSTRSTKWESKRLEWFSIKMWGLPIYIKGFPLWPLGLDIMRSWGKKQPKRVTAWLYDGWFLMIPNFSGYHHSIHPHEFHSFLASFFYIQGDTVDGRILHHLECTKPYGIMGETTYQLVQEFFHQQYPKNSPIFSVFFSLQGDIMWQFTH